MNKLEIVYLSPEELTPYEGNARSHGPDDIDQIVESIKVNGFNDPIGIWSEKNIIVEGHGRQIAALQMGLDKVPCIRLDHMTDDQRRDYAIRHNRTAELSIWDFTQLEKELAQLEIEGHDMSGLGFDFQGIGEEHENPYTQKTDIPQYKVKGELVGVNDLYSDSKTKELLDEIEQADIEPSVKNFLRIAAYRHVIFNYQKIAEFYAKADRETQGLMERSALVIIDINDAIKNGYTMLKDEIADIVAGEMDYE